MLLRYSQNRKVLQAEHLQTGGNKNSSKYSTEITGEQLTGYL